MALETSGVAGLAPFLGVPAALPATSAAALATAVQPVPAVPAAAAPAAPAPGLDDEGEGLRRRRPAAGKKAKAKKKDEGDEEDDENEEDDGADDDERDEMAAAAGTEDSSRRLRAVGGALERITAAVGRRARRAERERIGAILRHPNAAANLAVANNLAFRTRMTAAAVEAVLDGLPDAAPVQGAPEPKNGLAARMAVVPNPKLGVGAAPAATAAASIDSAWDRVLTTMPSRRA